MWKIEPPWTGLVYPVHSPRSQQGENRMIIDSPSLLKAEREDTWLGKELCRCPSWKKQSICVSSALTRAGLSDTITEESVSCDWGWGDSAGTGVLGPNQEKTANRLKSRSTSQPPPRLLPYLSPSSYCHSNSRLFHYSSLSLYLPHVSK